MNQELKEHSILIVEDNLGISDTLKMLLEMEGYLIKTARNGQEALELINNKYHPRLIILDMFMPVMDGWQFIECIKKIKDDGINEIPIVITSGAEELAEEAARLVQGYLRKPFVIDILIPVIRKFFVTNIDQRAQSPGAPL